MSFIQKGIINSKQNFELTNKKINGAVGQLMDSNVNKNPDVIYNASARLFSQ